MEKNYNPQEVEDAIYKRWQEQNAFSPEKKGGEPFVIALPPPNVTGQLHAGHAMYTVEDIMIRWRRMQGRRSLWVPGTDHAAIATETVVLKKLGVTDRNAELTRDQFLQEAQKFVGVTGGTIKNQLQKMGFSLDWEREAYTFDEKRNKAVNTIFQMLFEKGLIYRGNRLVNWSTGAQSVLADDELEWDEVKEPFYSIRCGEFIVGTVRSETKCADSPVLIHPDEPYVRVQFTSTEGDSEFFILSKVLFEEKERLQKTLNLLEGNFELVETFLGKELEGQEFEYETYAGKRKFVVMTDAKVIDIEKGTGAMTISPSHSADDYDFATRRKLDQYFLQKIDFKGKMTAIAGECEGLLTEEARKKSAEIMQKKGLLVGEDKEYLHRIPLCYRSGYVVEPMISKQWFIAVEKEFTDDFTGEKTTLKKQMQEAVRDNHVEIVPSRFEKTYFHWIDNLRDWCISRQIWWGHRIPVWYDQKGEVAAVGEVSDINPKWTQDEDTLDTWFSSATWPFSIFGWPDKTADFESFYPTSVLETGHDILFFWVARMIMFGRFATGKYPFKTVYLHGMVHDEHGKKMSKSKGNGIDPLEISKQYGTDAFRLSLVMGSTPGNNVNIGEDKIAGCRNFCNKLWNISRFILSQDLESTSEEEEKTDLQDWIIAKRDFLITEVNEDIEKYQFGLAAEKLWQFTWDDFADWAIEAVKAEKNPQTQLLLRETLEILLKLWHPFLPFVTEEIWRHIHPESLLIKGNLPKASLEEVSEKNFEVLRSVISKIRSLRKNAGVDPARKITAFFKLKEKEILEKNKEILLFLGRIEHFSFVEKFPDERGATDLVGSCEIFLPSSGMMDEKAEKQRAAKELEKAKRQLEGIELKLQNDRFLEKAPEDLVINTKKMAEELREKITLLQEEK